MNADAYHDVPVVVLGAAGFIGRWVARALSRQGARVTSVVRDGDAFATIRRRWQITGDVQVAALSSVQAVRDTLDSTHPAIVFNLVGYGVDRSEMEPEPAWWLNGRLPGAIAQALATRPTPEAWPGRRLVHVGSALEYGTVPGSLAEDGPTSPTTRYGRSKLTGTLGVIRVARRTQVAALTARLFTVYGPGEHQGRLLPSLLRAVRTQGRLELTSGEQARDFTWVGEVADLLLQLGLSDGVPGEVVNIASGQLITVKEFIERTAVVAGIHHSRLGFGVLPDRPEEMHHSPVANARLRTLVGEVPRVSIEEGIRRTLEFQERGAT